LPIVIFQSTHTLLANDTTRIEKTTIPIYTAHTIQYNTNTNTIMNVGALKTNITEIGTKLAKETKVKADALKEKAEEALANAKQKKAATATAGEEASDAADGGAPTTPTTSSKRSSATSRIQDTIAGVADRIKLPTVRVEEGSIADILLKAKSNIFHEKGGGADASKTDEKAVVVVVVAGEPSDFENIKTKVDDLASEMESTANDKESPKEKVQKNLILILGKLKAAQDKFVAMVEAKKKEKAAATATAANGEAEGEGEGDASSPDAGDERSKRKSGSLQLKNVLLTAEAAARVAFENAERVARDAAKKTGLFDGGTRKSASDTMHDIADANAEADAEEPSAAAETADEAPTTTEPEPAPAAATTDEPEVAI